MSHRCRHCKNLITKITKDYKSNSCCIWSDTGGLLGIGATAHVWKGRCMETGKEVAVKVYKSGTQMATHERALMKTLKHDNIVRFFEFPVTAGDKSPAQGKGESVLAMELCVEGSLLDLLGDPAHCFGLDDQEFLLLLGHLSSGLEYLQGLAKPLVHCDIKPGNLMRALAADGRSVYKLSDFGCTNKVGEKLREVGTPEYAHPDIARTYDQLEAQVELGYRHDLWSVACTLYHAAAGKPPFTPHGGRDNRPVLLEMVQEKPPQAIAASKENPDASITYDNELPSTCCLTRGLQDLLLPVLRGLLHLKKEGEKESCDAFHAKAKEIVSLSRIRVFHAAAARMITLYLPPDHEYIHLEDKIASVSVTGVESRDQILIHNGTPLKEVVRNDTKLRDYPLICDTVPLLLLQRTIPHEGYQLTSLADPCNFPDFGRDSEVIDFGEDAKVARKHMVALHTYCERAREMELLSCLIFTAAELFSHDARQQVRKVIESFEQHQAVADRIELPLSIISRQGGPGVPNVQKLVEQVQNYREQCNKHVKKLRTKVIDGPQLVHLDPATFKTIRPERAVGQVQELIKTSTEASFQVNGFAKLVTGRASWECKEMHRLHMMQLEKDATTTAELHEKAINYTKELFDTFQAKLQESRKQLEQAEQIKAGVVWLGKEQEKITNHYKSVLPAILLEYYELKDAAGSKK